jgi:hypothetical protein
VRLRDLPLPQRLLATWFLVALAAGFGAAQVNLRLQHAAADGEPGLSYDDVVATFHGTAESSLLTSKISPGGSMAKNLPLPADRKTVTDWVRAGAREAEFPLVAEVLARRCVRCHNPGGEMRQVPFAASRERAPEFARVKPLAEPGPLMSEASLAKSTHAHLFGMGTLFAVAGWLFLLAEPPSWLRSAGVSLPFAAMFLDIGCWWLARLHGAFAAGVLAGGALLALSFGVLIVWPLWHMWGGRTGCRSADGRKEPGASTVSPVGGAP